MTAPPRTPAVLRRDGVAVITTFRADGLPTVLHWGADLGPLEAADVAALEQATSRQTPPGTLDAAWRLPLAPQESDGWAGRPGVTVVRDGRPVHPRWTVADVAQDGPAAMRVTAVDPEAGLTLRTRLEVGAGGLVLVGHELTNDGPGPVGVELLEATLPVPTTAGHVTQFTGRWTREKHPVTTAMPPGSTTRTSRRGRGGHDAPWVTIASTGAPATGRARRGPCTWPGAPTSCTASTA